MNLDEALAMLAKEAERQGFLVHQGQHGVWRIETDEGFHLIVHIRNINGLLSLLKSLIDAGLDWTKWNDPGDLRRD